MMEEKVHVEFTIQSGKRDEFLHWLSAMTGELAESATPVDGSKFVLGFRADDQVERRASLRLFVDQMEIKLRKNDHKTGWREKAIDALYGLLKLEMAEFEIAHQHFPIAESRPELVDVANFALIVWDRLGMLDQKRSYPEQHSQATNMVSQLKAIQQT